MIFASLNSQKRIKFVCRFEIFFAVIYKILLIMKRPKILIADDESLNLLLYSEIFKNSGYDIVTAQDGLEAIQLVDSESPDLIILDWNMPRMDGLMALKSIKENPKTSIIPVIMITGIMTASENLVNALDAGAVDFIRKPFDRIELKSRVKSMLLLSRTMSELEDKFKEIDQNNRFINTLIDSLPNAFGLLWP
jgi:CheY-like chemotaxis protein